LRLAYGGSSDVFEFGLLEWKLPFFSVVLVLIWCHDSVTYPFCLFRPQATGVVTDDEVATAFQGFKLQSAGFKLRYYIYKIHDKKTIKIEKSGDRSKTYEDFCADLPDTECRYGLIDLEFESDDGRPTSKLVFITWNPDTGKIRDKMLYSGSKEAIKAALSGVGIHINATDHAELDFESSILPTVKKFA
jgi:cofilin